MILLTSNREDLVGFGGVLDAVCHKGSQVCLADGLACCQPPISKHDIWLAFLHQFHLWAHTKCCQQVTLLSTVKSPFQIPAGSHATSSILLHLSSNRLEESCWADDRVCDVPGCLQRRFKLELRVLELQEGLLDADCAQQHKVRCALLPGGLQRIHGCLVVDVPGVFLWNPQQLVKPWQAGNSFMKSKSSAPDMHACKVAMKLYTHLAASAAGQAGNNDIHRLGKADCCEGLHVLHISKSHVSAFKLLQKFV